MISSYYNYVQNESAGDGLFHDLSESLKLRLNISVKRKFINSCPLFRGVSFSCVVMVIQQLTRRIMIPEEVLCQEGDPGDEMYFIARGEV